MTAPAENPANVSPAVAALLASNANRTPGNLEAFPRAAAMAAKRRRHELEIENANPGDLIEGEGVFLGTYAPVDREGNSLGKIFNVFAAPRDLPRTMKYVEAVEYIAGLKNWHGHDGTPYATDTELYAALKDGSYSGGWIIPTSDILYGRNVDGKATTPDNLVTHKGRGLFKNLNTSDEMVGRGYPGWYWSSTEDRNLHTFVYAVRLSDGQSAPDDKNDESAYSSCRPVRLVPAPG